MTIIRTRNMETVFDELDRCPIGFTFDILGEIESDGVVRLDIIKARNEPNLVDESAVGYIGSFTKPSDYDLSEEANNEFIKWFAARLHAKYDMEVIQ